MSRIDKILKDLQETADPNYTKSHKEAGKQNKASYKETEKRINAFEENNLEKKDSEITPPKRELTPEEQEYVDIMYRNSNMEALEYDMGVDEKFADRQEKAIKGDYSMGNKTDVEAAYNGDNNYGEEKLKQIKDRKKKTDAAKDPAQRQLGKDIEILDDEKTKKKKNAFNENNNNIENKNKMRIVKAKKPFVSESQALKAVNRIPEVLKENGTEFKITDGVYELVYEWHGDKESGEAALVNKLNKSKLNEEKQLMESLFNYKASEHSGRLTRQEKINETQIMKEMMDMVKPKEEKSLFGTSEVLIENAIAAALDSGFSQEDIEEGFGDMMAKAKKGLGIGSGKFDNAIDKFKKAYANKPEILNLLTDEKIAELKEKAKEYGYDVRIIAKDGDIDVYPIDRGSDTGQGRVGGTAG